MKSTIIFLSLLLTSYCQDINVITNLVQDLITNENVPSVLLVYSCWSRLDNFHLVKESQISIQLNSQLKIAPRVFDDNTNKLWHFIDMRCNDSHAFLNKIDGAYFGHPYRWILFEPVADKLDSLAFLTDSNVLLVNFNTHLSRYDLKQGNDIKILPI